MGFSHEVRRKETMHLQRSRLSGTILPGIILGLVIGLAIAAFIAWTWNREPSYNERGRTEQERARAEKERAKRDAPEATKGEHVDSPEGKKAGAASQKLESKSGESATMKADSTKSSKGDVSPQDRERFDFYKILPGIEEARPVVEGEKKQDHAVSNESADDNTDTEAPIDKAKPKDVKKKKRSSEDEGQLDQLISKIQGEDKETVVKDGGTTAAQSPVSDAPSKPKRWLVQAGAFETEDEAERLKADLAMSGFGARIAKGRDGHDLPVYRVRLGPFRSEEEVDRVRSELKRQGIKVAIIPMKENR
jgi:cell division protein FtsN